jgi:arylsulfatase A-like enzyme
MQLSSSHSFMTRAVSLRSVTALALVMALGFGVHVSWIKSRDDIHQALGPAIAPADDSQVRAESARPPADLPNVLIIVTDDQRADSMEALPLTSKWFVDQGRWYPNAFATTPVCCPSRASIFSGRFAHNHDVRRFTPYKLNQRRTLQASLTRRGYNAAFLGKYLNDWKVRDDPPNFDEWAIFPQSNAETYDGGTWNVNGTVKQVGKYSTHFMRKHAFRFLEHNEGAADHRPWLMFLSTPAPHKPSVAEPQYRDADTGPWEGNEAVFEQDLSDKPPHVRRPIRGHCDFDCGGATRELQHRTLLSADDLVDAVMTRLTETGEADNTLAFFVSDNGLMWGEHGLGFKRLPYTQSAMIPLGMRWPDHLVGGFDERLVATVDIAPTILDAIGVPRRWIKNRDGRSLLSKRWSRDEMLLEHWSSKTVPTYAALRSLDHLYVEYYGEDLRTITFREFYDLEADPWELENLLADGDESTGPSEARLQRLHRRLRELRKCRGKDPDGPACP